MLTVTTRELVIHTKHAFKKLMEMHIMKRLCIDFKHVLQQNKFHF